MTRPTATQSITVNSGQSISGVFPLGEAATAHIWSPVVTSCQLFLETSFDQTSANFVRTANPAGSGAWTWSVGAGSASIVVTQQIIGAKFGRLATSAAQTAPRTFVLTTLG